MGSKGRGALRAEVANGYLQAMRYPRRACGVSRANSILELGSLFGIILLERHEQVFQQVLIPLHAA